jgi:siroheme synthase-like protein
VLGYPILLYLEGHTCVIVGGGSVAARKVAGLLGTGARVIVISPALHPTLEALVQQRAIEHIPAVYQPGMLGALRPTLVFAATHLPEVNQAVCAEARALTVLCDSVDDSSAGDFHSMATFRRGQITVGISTGGASPLLARHLRDLLAEQIGEEYALLTQIMDDLRPVVRTLLPNEAERAHFWRDVFADAVLLDGALLQQLRSGDVAAVREYLQKRLEAHVQTNGEGESRV